MDTVTSRDGTTIAFERTGDGPPVVLVGGALSDRAGGAALAAELAPAFTVLTCDRRGRGDSGDTPPYDVEREVEDVEALLVEAGGRANLVGHSSGGVLALRTAASHPERVASLAVYEPPFMVDDGRPLPPADYVDRVEALISAGRHGDAVAFFLTEVVGMPAEAVEPMRGSPAWPGMEALAHTIAYDGRVMAGTTTGSPTALERWSEVRIPVLVLDGGASPAWQRNAAGALADVLPHARHRTLEGQDHGPDPSLLGDALAAWLRDVDGR